MMTSSKPKRSDDFWKHQAWCVHSGVCGHKFNQCPYNKQRANQSAFHAPCCMRIVTCLNEKGCCKKCRGLSSRQCLKDNKDIRFEPEMFKIAPVKLDDTQLDKILSAAGGLGSSLDGLVTSIKTEISSLAKPLADAASQFLVKCLLCLSIVWRVKKDLVTVLLTIAQFLYSINVGSDLISSFQEYCSKLFAKLSPESFSFDDVFYVIAFVLSIILLGKKPCLASLALFYRNLCSVHTFSNAANSIFESIKALFNHAINFVKETFLGYDASWEQDKPYEVCIDWCTRVDKLFAEQTKESLWNDEMLDELDALNDMHEGILKLWRTAKPPIQVMAIMQSHASVLRRMLEEVSIQGVRQVPRVEPTFIMLQGKSAVGKSMITPILAIDLIKNCVLKKDVAEKAWSSYVFNRNAENTFWDGYAGQKIIVYDDFGQLYDTTGAPNPELMEVIRLGNAAPFFPNMARLEAKGRTRISCDFVLMSANKAPTIAGVQSMKEPEAVLRRIDFLVEVTVKAEYVITGAVSRVDYVAVLQDHYTNKCKCSVAKDVDMCLGHYLFKIKRWSGADWVIERDGLSYDRMLKLLVDHHKDRMERAKNRISYINNRLKQKSMSTEDNFHAQSGGSSVIVQDLLERFQYGIIKRWEEDTWIDLLFEVQTYLFMHKRDLEVEMLESSIFERIGRPIHFFTEDVGNIVYFEPQITSCEALYPLIAKFGDLLTDAAFNQRKVSFQPLLSAILVNMELHPEHIPQYFILFQWIYEIEKDGYYTTTGYKDRVFAALVRKFAYAMGTTMNQSNNFDCIQRAIDLYKQIHPDVQLISGLGDIMYTFRAYTPQGVNEIVTALRNSDEEMINKMREWFASLPCGSDDDIWDTGVERILVGEWDASFLQAISDQTATPLPTFDQDVKIKTRFQKAKEGVVNKLKTLYEKPLFAAMLGVGVAVVGSVFAYIFSTFMNHDDEVSTDMEDLVRIRMVGNEIKKSLSTSRAIKCDENDEEIYLRVDKKKLQMETITTTGDTGYVKKPKAKSDYSSWKSGSCVRSARKFEPRGEFQPHSYNDPGLQDVEKIVLKNLVQIFSLKDNVPTFRGHGLMIKGRVMLTFNHLFALKYDKFLFRRGCLKSDFVCGASELTTQQLSNGEVLVDAVLVSLPKRYQLCRDITAHFSSGHAISDKHYKTRMISMRGAEEGLVRIASGNAIAQDKIRSYDLDVCGNCVEFFVRNHYRHDMDTVKGDCGAVMLQSNVGTRAKILGIHVAGATMSGLDMPGMACAVTYEMIVDGCAMLNKCDLLSPVFDLGECDDTYMCPQLDDFDVLGEIKQGISDNLKSLIKKSPLYECLSESTTRPAILNGDIDGVNVKVAAIQKNVPLNTEPLEVKEFEAAVCEMKRVFNGGVIREKKVLSITESVFGIPGDPYINSLNMDSSSGYPWVFMATEKGKRTFIDMNTKEISPELLKACEERVMKAQRAERSTTVFSDHLKDERRKRKGQKFLKPRLFSGGPLDFTIVFRQYFGAYIAHIIENRITNTVAVGMNPHGMEWTQLAEYLHQVGDDVLAGDFSNYDGTLNAQMLWAVLDVIQEWYDDDHALIREVLWAEIVNSVHLFRNVLYCLDHGNPSGNPITTILNSMYQYGMWIYVIQRCGHKVTDFVKMCRIVTYGDDNVISAKKAFLDPQMLIDEFAKVNMKLTSDVKDQPFKYKKLDEVTFLKRMFAYNESIGRFLAPLDMDTVVEMIYWFKRPHQWREVGPDIVEVSVREMAHHQDVEFKSYVDAVRKCMEVRGLPMPPTESCAVYRELMLDPDYLSLGFII